MGISSGIAGAVGALPAGAVIPYAGSTAPANWLLCAGQAVSRTTYKALFDVIGSTYGSGDGSTTFNLPDLRGRIPAGKDDMGGTAASRLTSTTITSGATTLGNNGGAQTHTLTSGESGVPAHNHPASSGNDSPDHTHGAHGATFASGSPTNYTNEWNIFNGYFRSTSGADTRHTHAITVSNNTAANAGSAHNNVQPTIILNYIIKATAL